MSFEWKLITRQSVVFISAAEAYDLGQPVSPQDPHIVFNLWRRMSRNALRLLSLNSIRLEIYRID